MEDARRLILVLTDGDYHIALDGKVSENWFIERAFSYCLPKLHVHVLLQILHLFFDILHTYMYVIRDKISQGMARI